MLGFRPCCRVPCGGIETMRKAVPPNGPTLRGDGIMKVRTTIKAGGISLNQNETLARDAAQGFQPRKARLLVGIALAVPLVLVGGPKAAEAGMPGLFVITCQASGKVLDVPNG